MRLQAEQVWPELTKALATPDFTAAPRSASGRMRLADLPPSSSATRLMVWAASSATRRPAPVDPVNDTMSTPGWAAMASPTTGPWPLTMLKTPAGSPASWKISASAYAARGATSLGFSTTVHPAARAGATLQITWCRG